MNRRLPLVLLIVLQLLAGANGQQPQPSPTPAPSPSPAPATQQQLPTPESDDVVRITTNLVQVDAVVIDKNGKVVTDLKPEEIEILEDGRSQKVTHFSYVVTDSPPAEAKPPVDKNAPPPPVAPSRLKPEDVRRTIALVVDDLGLSFESVYYVRRALKKFVDEQMQTGDLVAVIRTSGGMGALQQFTSDKRQLYAAIERVKYFSGGRAGVSAFAPIEPPTEGDRGAEIDAANEDLNQFRDDIFSVGTLGAVTYVVRGLADLPGRKSILLISDGFRIYSQDDPTRNFRTLQKLQRLIDEAGRASVVIYTMNATGLQYLGATAADNFSDRDPTQIAEALAQRSNTAFETQDGLDYLARETGGIAIKNTNDLSRGIRRVIEDQKGYYVIGYRPSDTTFYARLGRRPFHHLTLKIKRPGKFQVRMRHGFYGVTDEERPKPRTVLQRMVSALVSPFGSTGIRLQLTSLFAVDPKLGSIMRSLLQIDARDLTFTNTPDGSHQSVFDLLALTFGDNGAPVDQIGQTYTVTLTDAEYQRAMREGMIYYVTVPLKKGGAYQLRISLRDPTTERIGSASQFIDAPDIKKKRLALSGIILRAEPRSSKPANVAAPQTEGVQSGTAETSPAVRHFKQGMLMTYAYYIYNAQLDRVNTPQLVTQVRLFHDGKQVFAGNETPYVPDKQADPKRLDVIGAILLGSDLPPGEYVLQIVVTDQLANKKHRLATQGMDFQIVR
jgi:VWFA-related protein